MENRIVILADMIRSVDGKVHLPPIDGVSLSELAKIVHLGRKFNQHLVKWHQIYINKYYDYDGYPLEDFYEVFYDATSAFERSKSPAILLRFESVSSDDDTFDYIAMAERDTTTAYKRGIKGTPKETKFRASGAWVTSREGPVELWIRREAARLAAIIDKLEASSKDLCTWSDNGFDMSVTCAAVRCVNHTYPPVIPNARLRPYADKGLTLEQFREKLKCSRCGNSTSVLSVI